MKAPVSLAWHEFAHAHFGHWTRTTRVMQMWERLSSHPSGTVSAVFEVPAERKGAYRFLESPKVRWEPLAEAVHVATARRCSRHALVIGIVDGSSIAHTDRRGDDGVGSVGSRRMGGRGIKSMILLAASFDGVPLGVGAHVLWSRPDTAGTSDALRPLAEKESRHWTELQEEFDRPTPFIYRSPKFIPATPDKLSIAVLPTTPVITARESMEGPATEVWRGSAVALVVPPVPVGGHPYPPTYFTIPNPLEIFGFEYEPTAYWTNAWLWTRLFVTGSGSAVALAGPSVFVSNGVLIVSTWGRCMSGELVATATRGGVELGQLSLTLVAENFLG